MDIFLTILGTVITALSFAYALYTNRRLAKLENYNREQAWEIYRQSSNTLSYFQMMNKLNINNIEFIKLNSQGERAGIELTVNSIRMIKSFEKKFNEEEIQKWSRQGKLTNDTHVKTFVSFI